VPSPGPAGADRGGESGPPPTAGAAPPSPARPRRRLRRRLFVSLSALVSLLILAAGVAALARHSLLAAALPRLLPGILADELGVAVAIDAVTVRTEGEELVVELRRIALGDAALEREGALPVRALEPSPIRSATADRLRIRLAGWLALRDGLAAVRGVELGTVEVVLPEESLPSPPAEPPGPEGAPPPRFAAIALRAPAALPAPPFSVRIARLRATQGEVRIEGSLRTREAEGDPDGVSIDLTAISGIAGLERASLIADRGDPAAPRLFISAQPLGLAAEARFVREERGWRLEVPSFSGEGFVARLEATIPFRTEDAASFRLHLESYDSRRTLRALGAEWIEGVPELESIEIEGSGLAGAWSIEARVATSVGALDLEARNDDRSAPGRILAEVFGEELPVGAIVSTWLPEWRPIATGDVQLWAEWGGGAPLIGGSIDLADGAVEIGGAQPLLFRRWATLGEWRPGGPLEIEATVLDLPQGLVTLEGRVPVDGAHEWRSEVNARGLELATIATLIPLEGVRELRGTLELGGSLAGPAAAPLADISGRLRDGVLAPAGWERLREVDAWFRWHGREVEIERVSARVGGGVAQGEGTILLGDRGVEEFRSELRFEAVSLVRSRSTRVRGRGTLRLAGTPAAPRVDGEVIVVRGIYDEDIHPTLGLGGGTSLPFDLFRFDEGFPSRLAFDVTLDLAGNFQVRNNRVRVAPYGELHLGGTGYQPVLTGAVVASQGQLILPRIVFEITQVEVRFPPDDPFRPKVRFDGRGTVRDVDIEAHATGELFAPVVTFSSSPSYPQEDLVLLVATGRFRDQIGASDVGVVAATELAQLYGPQVWGALFGPGSGSGESLLDRVQVGAKVSEETGEFDTVSVEVKLNEWLSVFAEQDLEGDATADLLFFWWLP